MTNLLQSLRGGRNAGRRADGDLTIDDWIGFFQFGGSEYPINLLNTTFPGGKQQEILPHFAGLADGAMRSNGIVWSCVLARMRLFSEARFQFRPKGSIAPGDLYGKPQLGPLEEPWPGGSTRQLLSLLDLYAQLDGNGYVVPDPYQPGRLRVPRPDWMTIVLGSTSDRVDFDTWDIDTEILGYIYRPFGANGERESHPFLAHELAHFKPIPDPVWQFRGMSWLTPVIKEVMADSATTQHKLSFLENGATPNLVVTLDPSVRKEEFEAWVDKFEEGHKGARNAYRTIYLAGGASATVVGKDLKELDFRAVQAHGETRVCNAAGIPPIIVGVSEGLDSATYSNYAQAKRAWADGSMRPLWGAACETLGTVVQTPADSELWYDERRIAFLREDLKDEAEIQQTQAATLKSLIDAGWKPESAAAFMQSGDLGKLVHTGLYSVQLQPPGVTMPPASSNGAPALPAQASLLCSLCQEEAASNAARCPRCSELTTALRSDRVSTVGKLAAQLATDPRVVEQLLAGDIPEPEPAAPRPLELAGPIPNLLAPVDDGARLN